MSGPNLPNMTLLSAIEHLKEATARLPISTPEGSVDGIVWQNFNIKPDSIKCAIFEKIDQAFTRCFSRLPGSGTDPMDNILRGSYGMDVVIRFFEECAHSPKLDSSASHLTELKVGQLTDLVYARIKSLPENPLEKHTKKKRRRSGKGNQPRSTRRAQASGATQSGPDNSSDLDFSPQSSPHDSESEESSNGSGFDDSQVESKNGLRISEPSQRQSKRRKVVNGVDDTTGTQNSQTRVDFAPNLIEYVGKKRGRAPVIREWAFAHHNEPIASFYPGTQKPAWVFKCRYCSSVHHFSRTSDIVANEKISATNLVAHLNSCKNLPAQYKLAATRNRSNQPKETLTPAQAALSKMFESATPITGPLTVTPSLFRSVLVQGVVRDNYPLTFGEGRGMRRVFALVSPGIDLPVHSTMRKDLNRLYEVLSTRVRQVLSAQDSRFAITSDAWTSKSFVYSLGGVIVTFIDKSWNMQELVLDIVHLDADHTGAGIGRRIFRSLDNMNAAKNVIASITDNASNNQTLNAELSTRLSKKYGYRLNVNHMSIICLCHALHLVCGAILSNLKAMDPMDNDEAYAIVKSFEEGEVFEQSAEVLEEEERLRGEDNEPDTCADFVDPSDDEWEDTEAENQPINSTGPYSRPSQGSAHGELNCVQKVHCIVVDITSSAARRKRMRMITRALGLELRAVIKGVKTRWNSILAEIRRAILLKPAINQYVATLDEGKSGAALRRARALKKKLTIVDDEWDALVELTKVLWHFESATRDYSTRGKTVLHSVLPTYAVLREKLIESRIQLSMSSLGNNVSEALVKAVEAGEAKLEKYFDLALKSDFTLLASIFHPGMRLRYFQDTRKWGTLGEKLVKRGQELIEYLYELYKQDLDSESNKAPPTSVSSSSTPHLGWIDGLLELNEVDDSAFPEEVRNYLDGKYQYKGGNILLWWKENELHIPVLGRAARDILAIPATSVSVERLFSRCKLVMSDYRNMSVDTARQIITCQQWLDAGLGTDLPDFVSNDSQQKRFPLICAGKHQ